MKCHPSLRKGKDGLKTPKIKHFLQTRLMVCVAPGKANWEPGDEAECVKSPYFGPNLAFLGEPGPTLVPFLREG